MVATAIAVGRSIVLGETAQNEQVVLELLERVEDERKLEVGPKFLGGPFLHMSTVGNVKEGEAFRRVFIEPLDRSAAGAIASSHGNATAAPTPRKTARRENRAGRLIVPPLSSVSGMGRS